MGRVYGDPIEVFTNEDGRPLRFVWRDQLYAVRRVLEHWVATRDWWRDPETAETGEREFWRVEASPDSEVGVYELRYDTVSDGWMLARAWD
jgi:uncharacterized protein DUF6504